MSLYDISSKIRQVKIFSRKGAEDAEFSNHHWNFSRHFFQCLEIYDASGVKVRHFGASGDLSGSGCAMYFPMSGNIDLHKQLTTNS